MNKVEVKETKKKLGLLATVLTNRWLMWEARLTKDGLHSPLAHLDRSVYDGLCQAIIALGGCWERYANGRHIVYLMGLESPGSEEIKKKGCLEEWGY